MQVGIDFGTSNSSIAVFNGGEIRLLPVDPRNSLSEVIKTVLYITREDQCFIGQEAIEHYYRDHVNRQRRYVKKWVGELEFTGADMHYIRDVFVEVDELKPGRLLQYLKTTLRKTAGQHEYNGTQIFECYYSVSDLIQAYLRSLKLRAEEIMGEPIDGAAIGRPVRFSDSPHADQRAQEILHQAALDAGFRKVQFELEPVAAARYYERSLTKPQTALIFDFGGGTLDLAILNLGGGQPRELIAYGGIDIAGSDFDRTIIEQRLLPFFGSQEVSHQPEIEELISAVPDWSGLPELSTPINRQNLLQAIQGGFAPVQLRRLLSLIYNDLAFSFYNQIEAAKITLSSFGAAEIIMEEPGLELWEIYTRHQFEKDIQEQKDRIEDCLMQTCKLSGLSPEKIDVVVRTGGSSNIPLFIKMLEQIFGAERITQASPFTSVAAGLAMIAFESS